MFLERTEGVRVAVIKTGTANTASVLAALERVGAEPQLTTRASDIERAPAVVLPGVGSFGAAMHEITRAALADAIKDRVMSGRATLCICLGLQVLAGGSEESPGVRGLGVIDALVTRFGVGVRVPHMGWNSLEILGSEQGR